MLVRVLVQQLESFKLTERLVLVMRVVYFLYFDALYQSLAADLVDDQTALIFYRIIFNE